MSFYPKWSQWGSQGSRRRGWLLDEKNLRRLISRVQDIFWYDEWGLNEVNIRKARCKVCGETLQPEEGRKFAIYAPNGWNMSTYYGHKECQDKARELHRKLQKKMKPTLSIYG